MKLASILTLLAGIATAAPVAEPVPVSEPATVEARQLFGQVGMTANEFTKGGCKPIIFIFARGSTEPGNMGLICGPPTANNLKDEFGRDTVAVEGVDYPAGLTTNFLPSGGDPKGVRDMTAKIQQAAQCGDSIIVAGGYSQGAAITHETIEGLSPDIVAKIAGVITFGDTQKLQSRGRIQGLPEEKLKIICALGDLVCSGTLIITASHLLYNLDAGDAADFLAQRIRIAQGGGFSAPASSGGLFGGFGGFFGN